MESFKKEEKQYFTSNSFKRYGPYNVGPTCPDP